MNVKELIIKGDPGEEAVAVCCGKCGVVHALNFRDIAERCCEPVKCSMCGGETESKSWLICNACRKLKDKKKEEEMFEKAEKIPFLEYKGEFLFHDALSNEGFIEAADVGDGLVDLRPEHRPRYAWACNGMGIGKIDARDIIENETQDHHEDAYEQLDEDGLQKVLDEWSEKQTMVSYFPDYKRAVLLDTVLNEIAEQEARKDEKLDDGEED